MAFLACGGASDSCAQSSRLLAGARAESYGQIVDVPTPQIQVRVSERVVGQIVDLAVSQEASGIYDTSFPSFMKRDVDICKDLYTTVVRSPGEVVDPRKSAQHPVFLRGRQSLVGLKRTWDQKLLKGLHVRISELLCRGVLVHRQGPYLDVTSSCPKCCCMNPTCECRPCPPSRTALPRVFC